MKELKFENKDKLPLIGLGTWLSKSNEVYDAVIEAIQAGYRHIDCAYIYGNEKEIGRALAFAFSSGLVTRVRCSLLPSCGTAIMHQNVWQWR